MIGAPLGMHYCTYRREHERMGVERWTRAQTMRHAKQAPVIKIVW